MSQPEGAAVTPADAPLAALRGPLDDRLTVVDMHATTRSQNQSIARRAMLAGSLLVSARWRAGPAAWARGGHRGVMVVLDAPHVNFVPLVSAINMLRAVPVDCDTIVTARDLGIRFGD